LVRTSFSKSKTTAPPGDVTRLAMTSSPPAPSITTANEGAPAGTSTLTSASPLLSTSKEPQSSTLTAPTGVEPPKPPMPPSSLISPSLISQPAPRSAAASAIRLIAHLLETGCRG
jgi:hypothetical protein